MRCNFMFTFFMENFIASIECDLINFLSTSQLMHFYD